jgi:Domain of unknown function (DUF4383)
VAVDVVQEPIRERDRAPLVELGLVISIGFLAVGILGFIPGITTHYGDLQFAGHDSDAKLLGVFQVSILHNLVHLLYGVVGLFLCRTVAGARTFLVGGGVIYLVLTVYGFLISADSGWNFVPVDRADDLLHLGLGLAMVTFGLLPERTRGAPGETLAGFLAGTAIFISAIGLAYRPLRLVPLAILLSLLAAGFGGRHARLAQYAVVTGAVCFVAGLAIAVVTSHPLW